jgi:NAD(P)-dependent dehydrogenase (short-subunit alcohol dehydrogenase family)
MGLDQYRMRDPRQQYAGAEEQGAEQQEAPGWTGRLGKDADHGEQTYRGSGRLDGRRAVITGGDSGIGRAVALAYAREGADLLLSHLPDEESDAQRTLELVREAGRTGLTAPGDIRDPGYCRRLIGQAVSELGGLDILVNNAAFQMAQPGGIVDISDEQFDQVMRTNLYGMFWLCRAAAPHLPPGGTIINVTSIQAHDSSPALLDYATTKAGIIAFTKALAGDLIRRGIRVNTVAPGPVWTPLIPATLPSDKVAEFGAETPVGRAGQPAELAPTFVYLASQESSYVTGEVIAVTGGRPMS